MRDIGEIAAIELLRREQASGPLLLDRIDLGGPDLLTGSSVAGIWSEVLGRPIAYAGDDIAAFEQTMRGFAPSWMAYDMRMMIERFQTDGLIPAPGDAERLTACWGGRCAHTATSPPRWPASGENERSCEDRGVGQKR
jgi:uncharacterized protein YbjT (DUF2867 family)